MDNKTRIDITALEEAIGDIQAVYHILIRLDPVLAGEGEAEMNSLLARTLQVAVDDLKEVLAEALEINRERKVTIHGLCVRELTHFVRYGPDAV